MINSGLLGRQGYRAWVAALSLILTFSLMMSQFAYAAIAFRAASSGNNAGGANSLSISMPTGVVEGDVMIAVISVRGGTGTAISTVPTGWAMINSNNSTTDIKSAMYYKIAITSEAGPYVWGWGSSLKASGVLSAYSGVDNSAPIMTHSNQVNTSGTSMTAPSVVTTADGAWIIAAYSTATGTTVSAGSSMDLRGQSASTGAGAGSRTTSGLQDIVQTSAGSSGTKTMTASSAAVNVGHTIALNPVASFEQSGYRWFVNADSTALPTFAQTWGGDSNDSNGTLAVALDSSGNIFTVGSTASSGMTAGSDDQSLVKYNSSGVEQWSKTWGGDGFDYANAVTFDTSGNIYVVGSTASTGWTAGSYDHTLVKYNSSGVEQWSKTWGGTAADKAKDIILDASGGINVVGDTASTELSAGLLDQTLLRFDSNGEIANCSSCVDRTVTEVDRTTSETDRTVTEVDRTTSETDRTVTEVDRTGIATITLVCDGTPAIDVDSPLGGVAQNTSAIAPEAQQIFRLRLLLHVSAGSALGGHAFKLQYASMSGACDTSFTGETYADVTTVSTIAYADNTNAVEGQSLVANANDPTHTGHTKIAQEYNESNNTISKNTVAPGQDGLWDFALKDNGAPAGENYCFRIVRSDNSFLSTYSFIPQIAIASDLSGPTIEQQLRGGQSVVDGVKQGFTW